MSNLVRAFASCAAAVNRYRLRREWTNTQRSRRPMILPASSLKDTLKLALQLEKSKGVKHG